MSNHNGLGPLVCAAILGLLLAATAASAEDRSEVLIDYNFVEVVAAPWFDSPISFKIADEKASFQGWGVGGIASYALHPNFSFRVATTYQDSDTGGVDFLEDPDGELLGVARINFTRLQVTFGPMFNYRVGKRTDILIGVSGIWEDFDFRVRLDLTDPEGSSLLSEGLSTSDWGVAAKAGFRSRVWRGLELYADANVSSVALLDAEIFFNLGARYFLWETVALTTGVTVGTDSFVGIVLGLRLNYMEMYQRLSGRGASGSGV